LDIQRCPDRAGDSSHNRWYLCIAEKEVGAGPMRVHLFSALRFAPISSHDTGDTGHHICRDREARIRIDSWYGSNANPLATKLQYGTKKHRSPFVSEVDGSRGLCSVRGGISAGASPAQIGPEAFQ
jgi:hypothetical protein